MSNLETYREKALQCANAANSVPTPLFRPGAVVFKYLDYTWFDDHDYDFTHGLRAFERPIWILAGTKDRVLGDEFQQQQVPLFHDAQLVALEGDGHNDPVTKSAARTVRFIREYLDVLAETP